MSEKKNTDEFRSSDEILDHMKDHKVVADVDFLSENFKFLRPDLVKTEWNFEDREVIDPESGETRVVVTPVSVRRREFDLRNYFELSKSSDLLFAKDLDRRDIRGLLRFFADEIRNKQASYQSSLELTQKMLVVGRLDDEGKAKRESRLISIEEYINTLFDLVDLFKLPNIRKLFTQILKENEEDKALFEQLGEKFSSEATEVPQDFVANPGSLARMTSKLKPKVEAYRLLLLKNGITIAQINEVTKGVDSLMSQTGTREAIRVIRAVNGEMTNLIGSVTHFEESLSNFLDKDVPHFEAEMIRLKADKARIFSPTNPDEDDLATEE